MGLWQNLVTGYNENKGQLSNVAQGGLYPLSSTTITNAEMVVVVVLDKNGEFIRARIIPKVNNKNGILVQHFVIPVSEKSLGRSGKEPEPHPFFDKFEYMCGSFGSFGEKEKEKLEKIKKDIEDLKERKDKIKGKQEKDEYKKELNAKEKDRSVLEWQRRFSKDKFKTKRESYLEGLGNFSSSKYSIEQVNIVYKYITSGNIGKNLQDNDIFPEESTFILFEVEMPNSACSCLWKDSSLFSAWHSFYMDNKNYGCIDFIAGECLPISEMHPKKIYSKAGNAKLISANDSKNFTFRGIFKGADEAVSVGYESSQKAHQYLRYLIANHGISCGDQVIVPFSIGASGKRMPSAQIQDVDDWNDDETETSADTIMMLGSRSGMDYAKSIRKALHGYELDGQWRSHARSAIVILEAATPGRLSITFYREFLSAEYMESIARWHEECKWPLWRKKEDRKVLYFGAPSIDGIIQAAFGWPKLGQDKGYEKIRMRARQNLIRSIFDNASIPIDYVENAILRVSNPLGITDGDGKFDRRRFDSVLSTTCAIYKKHATDNKQESFDMSIDLNRTDRDYLYGRLLGAADKLEQYALRKKGNDRLITAAIRYMQTFSQRPYSAWQNIHQSLIPYKQQVRGSIADRELQAITNLFNGDGVDFSNDSPLSGLFLVGYYHECAHIDELIRVAHEKFSDNNNPKED